MNKEYDDEIEIDIGALLQCLLKKWWMILICAMICAGVALGGTILFITPKYQSSAMLYILNKTTSVTSLADIQIGSALTADFEVIATSKPVVDGAIETLKKEEGKTFTRKEIFDMISVTNKDSTRILVITATSENPQDASIVANAVAENTAIKMGEITKSDPPTTVENAETSENPISPSLNKNTVLGFLAGAVLICAILIIQFLLNDNINTEEDVEKYLGLSTLVAIPKEKGRNKKKQEVKKLKEGSYETKK